MALKAGLNPLRALGLPDDLTLTPDVALLIHELLSVLKEDGQSESELDDTASAIVARMDFSDSRERALLTGYTGPRGHLHPVMPRTAQVVAPPCITVGLHPDTWAKLHV